MRSLSEGEVARACEEEAHGPGSGDGLAAPVSQTHVELSVEGGPEEGGGR